MEKYRNMMICAYPAGNHSNRLFQNLHFESFCKEYNIEYINPSFFDIYKYYISPCSLNKGLKGVIFMIIYIRKFITIMVKLKLLKFIIFDNEGDNYEKILLKICFSRDVYVGGWNFRVEKLSKKYQDYFIGKYSLKEEYIKNNDVLNLINENRGKKIIVGVHIRRGDYKNWQGGKYYFDYATYKRYIYLLDIEIKKIYGKDSLFIIFSNENISIDESEYICKSNNEWYIDHFLMSKCDFLIGPPSTFTMWASYIGKVKYYHIENPNDDINLDNFKYCYG